MKRAIVLLCVCMLITKLSAQTIEFETASAAVKNMKVGWNLGNSLDAVSTDTTDMHIERWTDRTPKAYETSWGQPVTKPELFKIFKDAGFNAIRVPVTWYPHLGSEFFKKTPATTVWSPHKQPITGDIDPVWIERVRQVVDYVIAQDMYCILNVHHDTGAANTAWIIADGEVFNRTKDLYAKLWTQIAEEFKDYGDKLIFEGYNEMLDKYDSWCFASMNAPGGYSRTDANDAYNAINNYAQTFVDAVRATGGNNSNRNLIVTPYAACSGQGKDKWSDHLNDPYTKFVIPEDTPADGKKHLILQIHYYQQNLEDLQSAKTDATAMLTNLRNKFPSYKIPVIIGEWGSLSEADNDNGDYKMYKDNLLEYCRFFVQEAKKKSIATFYWKGLSDGDSRSVPEFNQPDLVDAIIKGYYGAGGYNSIDVVNSDSNSKEYQYIYKLDGTKVSDMNTPGLYIINGKKYLKR
ncbi:MAG: glycoside hydrolase family 5 protein [Bacteroidaceae bacterium]|nr:glycoside hydrolase family 5 protein [Bacteroidaceae bacterium]